MFRSFFGPVLRDRRGVAAVFLAVALVPVLGAIGLAVDSSVGYLLKTRIGKSLDAAGLAAGRNALDGNGAEIARDFFDGNFGAGAALGNVTVTDFDYELDGTGHFITLEAQATTPTYFMRVFGRDEMTVSARTVIERRTTGMELALALDNTGSLWASDTKTNYEGTPFSALRDAAYDLIDIIYGDETELDNVWVSLVPFVAAVNIGSSRTGWLQAGDPPMNASTGTSDFNHFRPAATNGGWKGCVMARAYPYDGDDTPPATQPFSTLFYPKTSTDNNYTWTTINDSYQGTNAARKGPNLGCGTPITSLTKSRATIEAGIGAMRPWRRGGTTGNLGLAWGWRTISPKWRGLWGGDTPSDMPLAYETNNMDKIVVLLTDGNQEFYDLDGADSLVSDYTAYGRVNAPGPVGLAAASRAAGVTTLNTRLGATCTAMKQEGVRIYTIIFGAAPNATTRALYEACATSPAMYYYATTNQQLADAFRSIGGQLANLLIVE